MMGMMIAHNRQNHRITNLSHIENGPFGPFLLPFIFIAYFLNIYKNPDYYRIYLKITKQPSKTTSRP